MQKFKADEYKKYNCCLLCFLVVSLMQSMMARQEESVEVITCIGDVMLDRVRPTKCTFFGTDCYLVPRFVFVVVIVMQEGQGL